MMIRFRFQDLDIWQQAIEISDSLYGISKQLNANKYYRFAEQLRGATMSISNNIAEGSGSSSKKDFAHFLNIAHRSAFEISNILINLNRQNLIDIDTCNNLNNQLNILCRRITNFRKTLFR